MAIGRESLFVALLISHEGTRVYLHRILSEESYRPEVMTSIEGLLERLRDVQTGVILLDGQVVRVSGPGLYSRIHASCRGCRIILFCDQADRELIKEAMERGVYGCIVEPYPEWEVLTMVKHIAADVASLRRKDGEGRGDSRLG